MPEVAFEPMIPLFERAKTFHALDRAAIMIDKCRLSSVQESGMFWCFMPSLSDFEMFTVHQRVVQPSFSLTVSAVFINC
jgi:hypothetical protein